MESPWALPSFTANRSPIVLHANQRPALCGAFCLVEIIESDPITVPYRDPITAL